MKKTYIGLSLTLKDPQVHTKSLAAIRANPPVKTGNYFTIIADNREYRIANCWYENFIYIKETKGTENLKVEAFESLVVITDRRFPDEYLYQKINVTGWGYSSLDQLIDIHRYMGLDYLLALKKYLANQ